MLAILHKIYYYSGMKTLSLEFKLVLIGVAAMLTLGAAAILYSVRVIQAETSALYTEDYAERIRNIEFEYSDLGAVVAASATADASDSPAEAASDAETGATEWTEAENQSEVAGLQSALLSRLNKRFIAGRDLRAQPFIFNGDHQVVLYAGEEILDAQQLIDAAFQGIEGTVSGEQLISAAGKQYWVIHSYYPAWDWYTGYVMQEQVRQAGLYAFTRNIAVVILVMILLFTLIYLQFLIRTLKPLRAIPPAMQRFLDGDVNLHLQVRGKDVVARIGNSFNEFVVKLREILQVMKQASDSNQIIEADLNRQAEMAAGRIHTVSTNTALINQRIKELDAQNDHSLHLAQDIAGKSNSLKQYLDSQLAAVNQSSAAIEEMTASLDNVASITATKKQSAISLAQRAREGSEQLTQLQEAMQATAASVDEIGSFVDLIKSIASQTNLLSMNAAIEAAHAGESGKGFAVVADEIRKLASDAGENSGAIATLIDDIVARIRRTTELSIQSGRIFEVLDSEIQLVADSLQEIAAATDELASGSTEIRQSMNTLNSVSATVHAESEQMMLASSGIIQAIQSIVTISSQVISQITAIKEDTEQNAGDLDRIRETAGTLAKGVTALQNMIQHFNLQS